MPDMGRYPTLGYLIRPANEPMKIHEFGIWLSRLWPLVIPPGLYFLQWWGWPAAAADRFGANGSGEPTLPLMFGQLAAFASPLVILGLIIAKLVCRTRWTTLAYHSLLVLGSAVAVFTGAEAGRQQANAVVKERFLEFALRSEPIVAAVEGFTHTVGRAPTNMAELVPRFLPQVPTTGIPVSPRIDLIVGPKLGRYPGNLFALRVQAGGFGLKWDECLFLPDQNYRSAGQFAEPVGRWALIHW